MIRTRLAWSAVLFFLAYRFMGLGAAANCVGLVIGFAGVLTLFSILAESDKR